MTAPEYIHVGYFSRATTSGLGTARVPLMMCSLCALTVPGNAGTPGETPPVDVHTQWHAENAPGPVVVTPETPEPEPVAATWQPAGG